MRAREGLCANIGVQTVFSRTSKPGRSAARLPSRDEKKTDRRSESWWKSLDLLFLHLNISAFSDLHGMGPVSILTDMGVIAEFREIGIKGHTMVTQMQEFVC